MNELLNNPMYLVIVAIIVLVIIAVFIVGHAHGKSAARPSTADAATKVMADTHAALVAAVLPAKIEPALGVTAIEQSSLHQKLDGLHAKVDVLVHDMARVRPTVEAVHTVSGEAHAIVSAVAAHLGVPDKKADKKGAQP